MHTRYAPVRHSHAPEGAFTVRLACIRPAASVHPEPGSNSSLYYCLASCFSLNLGFRLDVLLCLPFLERFLPLTPLSRRRSCAGLRLSKNLLPSLLSSVPLVPWGNRVQKYYLFLNWQALFSNIFHLFYILLTTREKKVHLLWVFPSFRSVFRGKNGSQGGFSRAFFGPTAVFLRQIWRKSGRDESGWEEDTLLYIIGPTHPTQSRVGIPSHRDPAASSRA